MGQKVHPGGMRVGVIHDWKSNWYTGKKEFPGVPDRGHQDPGAHHQQAFACRAVRHPDPQGQAADHRRHLHGAPRNRDRQVGRRGGRAAQRAARDHQEERPHQHQRDQAPRARRQARRPVDRRAAAEPRQLPARDEARARVRHSLGREGRPHPVRRPAGRHRDEPLRGVLRRTCSAAHDSRGHRLRLRRGEDDLRPHRREGLDQQGRDHAGGLRRARHREGRAPRRAGSGPQATRERRGPRRLARGRPRPPARPRGSRSRAPVPQARRRRPRRCRWWPRRPERSWPACRARSCRAAGQRRASRAPTSTATSAEGREQPPVEPHGRDDAGPRRRRARYDDAEAADRRSRRSQEKADS